MTALNPLYLTGQMTGQSMKHVQASEAKAKFAELLDEIERGETLVITRHGKPIAEIRPAQEGRDAQGRQAMLKLMELRKKAGRATVEEILAWRDEGRRF